MNPDATKPMREPRSNSITELASIRDPVCNGLFHPEHKRIEYRFLIQELIFVFVNRVSEALLAGIIAPDAPNIDSSRGP